MDVDSFMTAYGHALDEAATLGAEYEAAKAALKRHYARLVVAAEGSKGKAEYAAEASGDYDAAAVKLDELRLKMARAKAKAEHMTARLDVWRTRESSRRAQQQRRSNYGTQEAQDDER